MLPRHNLILLLSFFSSTTFADSWSNSGCYKSSSLSNLQSQGYYIYQSSGHCEQVCAGKRIAALISGSQCYCGDSDPTSSSVDSSNCGTSCQGYGTEKCGGDGYYTVYVNSDVESQDTQQSSSSSSSSSTSSTSSSTSSSSSSSSTSSTSSSSSSSSQQPQTSTIKETTTASPSSTSNDETSQAQATTSSQTPETKVEVASSVQPTTIVSTVVNSANTKSQSVIYRTIIESPSSQPSSSSATTTVSSPASSSGALEASRTGSSATLPSSASSSSSESSNSNKNKGTSGGVIAGAVVGSVAGVAVIAGLLFAFCWFRRRRQDDEDVDDQFTLSGPKQEMSEVDSPTPPPSSDPNPFLLASGYNYFDTSQQQQFPNGTGRSPSLQQTPRQYNNNQLQGHSQTGSGASAAAGVFGHHQQSSSSGTSGGGGDHSLGSHGDDYAFFDIQNGGDGSLHHTNSLPHSNGPHTQQPPLQQQQQQQQASHQFQFLNANSPEPGFGRRKLSNGSLPDMIAREPGSLKVVNN
ncbi:WSC2 [Candida theae]|uniref:WSC2 n=1 Tax=Candida theae TaxID=1198502 RepID=A0AAD5FX90_9ASCO|nr:WSC2 [Candida theae]KAI5952927.1 WSC2 [Candida theae]